MPYCLTIISWTGISSNVTPDIFAEPTIELFL